MSMAAGSRLKKPSRNSTMPGGGAALGTQSNLYSSMDDAAGASNFAFSGAMAGSGGKQRDHRKFDKEKPRPYLDFPEFLAYMLEDPSPAAGGAEGERPILVDDIVHHLTGIEFQPVKQSIREEDEFAFKKPLMPDYRTNDALAEFKKLFGKEQYNSITSAFEKLWGENKEDQVKGAHVEGSCALTEENFMKNIKHVIGVDEPYFGKCLYLWMAQGYDRVKITLVEFIDFLVPFKGEDKQHLLFLCFEILDIDKDQKLNILNLLHLSKNLKPHTILSQEVITIMDEYLAKNVINSSKRTYRIDIDFEGYRKLVTSSCLQSEIRRKFWGLDLPKSYDPNEPRSICQTLREDQLSTYYAPGQLADRSFLYENIDYYDDVIPGQRGFGRNVDRLSNQLINFYHQKFKAQADETMKKIAKVHRKFEKEDIDTLKKNAMMPLSQQRRRIQRQMNDQKVETVGGGEAAESEG